MYTEEYENRGFPFRDFLLKLILIIIFVFLLIWLLPKFISPTIDNKVENNSSGKDKETAEISALTSQIFSDNIEKMKEAAIAYYTDERLPKEVGESHTMTLSDMIGKKLIVALIDKNNKACDVEKSYVKITKLDEEYILKVNLKSSDKEDYILVHLGCYTYCDSYICEKKETEVAIKASKPTSSVPIKGATTTTDKGTVTTTSTPTVSPDTPDMPKPTDEPTSTDDPKPSVTPTPVPTDKPGYVYQYQKKTGVKLSSWTLWSDWSKTSCTTSAINCDDDDISCLKKVQLYQQKEKIGTYEKKYVATRSTVVQVGSYQQKSCSKYNYVIINNKTYATTKSSYNTINQVTLNTAGSIEGWTYNGRAKYKNPPRDTSTTRYIFVGADYSYCLDTCSSLPYYWYDSYTYNGGLSSVSSTTSVVSSSTSVSASCGEYVTKTIPIYATITTSDVATRMEPLYGTVCYQSSKTRKITSAGKTLTKWSSYNDTDLLNNGWYYTGKKKKDQ